MNALRQQAIKGVAWSAVERFSVQIIQFIISIILARLLLPSDFGLIAIVMIIINVLQTINETGFGAALINKQNRDELDFSTVFVLNIFLGFFLYAVLYILAPSISVFFKQPQLTHLSRLIGFNLIITSFVVVQRAKLMIKVDFKTQAKASFISAVISGIVGIYTAYNGFGAMALVIQSLLNNTLNTLLIWTFVKWRPKLQLSLNRLKSLFDFAYKLILARLINTVFVEAYSFVIGKVYTPEQLGYFNRAKSFQTLSSDNIAGIVQRVSTPVLCEVQNDHKQLSYILIKFVTSTAFVVYPLLSAMFVLARPLVSVLLTDKWLPAASMLKILCPVGLFYVISTFNRNVFNATGRTDWALKTEIIKKIIFIGIIILSLYFGFTALLISQIVIAIIEFFVDTHYTQKQIGITPFQQLKSLTGIILASLAMALLIKFTTYFIDNDFFKLMIGIVVGIIVYGIICLAFNVCNFKINFQSLLMRIKK